jgi:uncharacterized protein (DUF427 family)
MLDEEKLGWHRWIFQQMSARIAASHTDEGIMTKAIWNGAVLAESDRIETVEGNAYFPPDSIKREYFRETNAHTVCPWKGVASYYDLAVKGSVNKEAAWYYPQPKEAANKIAGYVAFWKGVEVTP